MPVKKLLGDVFKTVGRPPYTYVKPSYCGEVRADVQQPGKHLLIEGPSGIGKTCVVYKVFEDLARGQDFEYVSGRDLDVLERLDQFLGEAIRENASNPPVLVVDDFHLFPAEKRAVIGASLKRISDRAFEHLSAHMLILIGIPVPECPCYRAHTI
jgi:hypothetical protein